MSADCVEVVQGASRFWRQFYAVFQDQKIDIDLIAISGGKSRQLMEVGLITKTRHRGHDSGLALLTGRGFHEDITYPLQCMICARVSAFTATVLRSHLYIIDGDVEAVKMADRSIRDQHLRVQNIDEVVTNRKGASGALTATQSG